jgi:hypothetical protein
MNGLKDKLDAFASLPLDDLDRDSLQSELNKLELV